MFKILSVIYDGFGRPVDHSDITHNSEGVYRKDRTLKTIFARVVRKVLGIQHAIQFSYRKIPGCYVKSLSLSRNFHKTFNIKHLLMGFYL